MLSGSRPQGQVLEDELSRYILMVCLLVSATAHADIPSQSLYLGVYGGTQLQLTSWHLHKDELIDDTPGPSGVAGLRIGGFLHPLVALEASIGAIPFESSASDTNLALNYGVDLQLHFYEGGWVPYLDLGVGLYHNVVGDHGADIDYNVHYGLGVRGMLTDWLALRVDIRHAVSDGFLDELAHNLEVSLGLDFFLLVSSPTDT